MSPFLKIFFKSHLRDIICGYFFKKGHTVYIVHIQGVHDGDRYLVDFKNLVWLCFLCPIHFFHDFYVENMCTF